MRGIALAAVLLAIPPAVQAQASADPCATVPSDSKQRIDGRKSGSFHTSSLPASFAGDGCDMLLTDSLWPPGEIRVRTNASVRPLSTASQ